MELVVAEGVLAGLSADFVEEPVSVEVFSEDVEVLEVTELEAELLGVVALVEPLLSVL